MLREETLQRTSRRTYEEPEGEFLEMIDSGSRTITVLTRVDTDKVAAPIDPSEYSVSSLEEEIGARGDGWTNEQVDALLEAEEKGKDRKTAKAAIKDIHQ